MPIKYKQPLVPTTTYRIVFRSNDKYYWVDAHENIFDKQVFHNIKQESLNDKYSLLKKYIIHKNFWFWNLDKVVQLLTTMDDPFLPRTLCTDKYGNRFIVIYSH